MLWMKSLSYESTQPFICSKSTLKTPERCVKSVQSSNNDTMNDVFAAYFDNWCLNC